MSGLEIIGVITLGILLLSFFPRTVGMIVIACLMSKAHMITNDSEVFVTIIPFVAFVLDIYAFTYMFIGFIGDNKSTVEELDVKQKNKKQTL